MFRKRFAVLFAVLSLVICFSYSAVHAEELDFYADVRGRDLSGLDLRKQLDVLLTLTFDTYTTWPAADRLPEDFDPLPCWSWVRSQA